MGRVEQEGPRRVRWREGRQRLEVTAWARDVIRVRAWVDRDDPPMLRWEATGSGALIGEEPTGAEVRVETGDGGGAVERGKSGARLTSGELSVAISSVVATAIDEKSSSRAFKWIFEARLGPQIEHNPRS